MVQWKEKVAVNARAVLLESAQGYLAPLRVAIGTNAQHIFVSNCNCNFKGLSQDGGGRIFPLLAL